MNFQKDMGFLGLCRKAGYLLYGHDTVKSTVISRKAKLVILASDASDRLKDEMKSLSSSEGRAIPVVEVPYTKQDFFEGIGKNAGVFSVTEQGFSDKLKTMFGEA